MYLGTVQELIDELEEARRVIHTKMANFVEGLPQIEAESMGLDPRGAHHAYVAEDAIIIRKSQQRMVEYYWGFEYVDREDVEDLGQYVAYGISDGRVERHHESAMMIINEDEEE